MIRAHRVAAGVVLACIAGCPALCGAAQDPASNAAALERPFIALLMPLGSPDFSPVAEAVIAGCNTALTVGAEPLGMQVHRTDATRESIDAAYRAAVERGAAVVVGPLTRDGVSSLARGVLAGPPVLALNAPDSEVLIPDRFYLFGLSADAEARVVARDAYEDGAHEALIVQAAGAVSQRMAQAFASEWAALGLAPPEVIATDGDLPSLRERVLRSRAEIVFLAADAREARQLRPYLNNQLPVYATSLLNSGNQDALGAVDLNGIRFVDMPWLVQPDHPAVMVYPRNDKLPDGLQRFYALGIDACRLAPLIAQRQRTIELDGVTGHLRLRGTTVEREPLPAVFRDGAVAARLPEPAR